MRPLNLTAHFFKLTLLIVLCCVTLTPTWAVESQRSRVEFLPAGMPSRLGIRGVEFDSGIGRVRYYYRPARDPNAPLIVFLPGSGCQGAYPMREDGKADAGNEIFAIEHSAAIGVIKLEMPGIPRQYLSMKPGSAEGCPSEYLQRSTLQSQVDVFLAGLDDARKHGLMSAKLVAFVGMSEGVNLAVELAAATPETVQLTLISGFGPHQLFDDLHLAMGTWVPDRKTDTETMARTKEAFASWQQIFSEPKSTEQFYRGHTFARWASTGLQSTLESVLKLPGKVRLYLVHGGKDVNASPAGFEFGISTLMTQKRSFAMQFIPCADHWLMCETDQGEPKNLEAVIRRSVTWLLEGKMEYENVIVVTPK